MSHFRRAMLSALAVFLFFSFAAAQRRSSDRVVTLTSNKKVWIDSVYNSLTLEERIGQLFMVSAYSGGKAYNDELITRLISEYHIGGLIFMQGGPARQAMLTNKYQRMSRVPLLIGMDAEWGLGMRFDSVRNFPRQMMLGATRDTALAYRMGAAIAYQCKRLGVNIDFAPVVDVNNNPSNPVINSRSFGQEKYWVARMGIAYMRGLQSNGVLACAKHFPGHGNTDADSHKELPLISVPVKALDTLELYPFRQLIAAGVKSIMVAHLEVPALESAPHVPTTLSKNVVTDLLRNKLGYTGLVFTDALNMQAVTNYFPSGEADMRAFAAGNDVLLFSQDVPAGLAKIKAALESGTIPMGLLENSVRRILAAKYDAGLTTWKDIDHRNILNDLNKVVDPVNAAIARSAITLVRDDNQIISKIGAGMHIGYVGINASGTTPLFEHLQDRFNNVKARWMPKGTDLDEAQSILDNIANDDVTIVAVHNLNFAPTANYGLSSEAIAFLQSAGCRNNVMVVLMGNAYAGQYFCGAGSVMVAYEDDTTTERVASEVLLKKVKAKGRLPVTACLDGKSVCPITVRIQPLVNEPAFTLRKVVNPAEAGVTDKKALDRLDMFMARNIAEGVYPGCRVLAAKNGKIFYDKAFGYMKYDKKQHVDLNTIYDMASCTKVLATLLSVMRLYEQGKIDLGKTIGDYLPAARGTNKAGLHVKDLLLHQAGLKSYIPFYRETLDERGYPRKDIYSDHPTAMFSIQVARDLYIRSDYPDTMWAKIYAGPLENTGKMVYSDLDFYFLAAIVQQITGKTIDKYADEQFYKPLGLKRITFNPLKKFDSTQIAPTEVDQYFRHQLLMGYVHDQGASMTGGVAGHAGLFASAEDVAVILQMLLNKGVYAKTRYFKAATIDKFTAYNSGISHRGLGFDKPLPEFDNGGSAGDRCSGLAFGHQGYTGTCVWADPATGILFIFLSNRVHPTADNTKLAKMGVRTVAQDYIYEAFGIPVNHERPELYRNQVKAAK